MRQIQWITLALALALSSCSMYKEVEVQDITDVRVMEFSEEKVSAEVDLKVKNPNWYGVKLVKSEVYLELNGAHVGDMKLQEKVKIPRKAVSYHTLKVIAEYEDVSGSFLQNFLTLIFNPVVKMKAEGYIKGRALIIGKKVPILVEEDINLQDINIGGGG
ncbi:MAG: LEA type 2 family protein [Flavobacteriales bacterium]|nr:LEA type 2 family protein [Flavobacteriales bacterium]